MWILRHPYHKSEERGVESSVCCGVKNNQINAVKYLTNKRPIAVCTSSALDCRLCLWQSEGLGFVWVCTFCLPVLSRECRSQTGTGFQGLLTYRGRRVPSPGAWEPGGAARAVGLRFWAHKPLGRQLWSGHWHRAPPETRRPAMLVLTNVLFWNRKNSSGWKDQWSPHK